LEEVKITWESRTFLKSKSKCILKGKR